MLHNTSWIFPHLLCLVLFLNNECGRRDSCLATSVFVYEFCGAQNLKLNIWNASPFGMLQKIAAKYNLFRCFVSF